MDKTINNLYADNPVTVFTGAEKGELVDSAANSGGALYSEMKKYFSVIKHARIQLTAAQVRQLFTTPQTIIAAPGANKAAFPLWFTIRRDGVTTGFSTNLTLQTITGAVLISSQDTSSVLSSSTDYLKRIQASVINYGAGTPYDFINAPMVLKVTGGNPTGGDGTLTVDVIYEEIDFS